MIRFTSNTMRLILAAAALAACWAPSRTRAAESAKPAILFVASRHELGSAGYRFLVDPKHRADLEAEGWAVGYATLSSVTWEKLSRFNVVVLQQHPDVERFKLEAMFSEACALIPRYVEAGGGVLVFGDLHRGRIYGNLNRLLKPFGACFHYQVIEERAPSRVRELATYRAVKALLTDNIAPSPLTEGVQRIWYPHFGETTATFGVDENWQVAVRGSATAFSKRLSEDRAGAGQPVCTEAPPIAAHRQFGAGRIVLFSSHSSWYTLNPYHFMWEGGFFLRQGHARRLLLNAYRFLAAPSLASASLGGFEASQQKEVFDISPRLKENVRQTESRTLGGRPRDGVIGVHTRYSGGTYSVDEFCAAAKGLGFDYLVFTEDNAQLDAGKWRGLVQDCARNTDSRFLAIPGVRFRGEQSGNEGVLFNSRKPWSELPWDEAGFDAYTRLGCKNGWTANLAQVRPNGNPFPYYNQGAVNAHTLFSYGPGPGDGLILLDNDWQTFLDTNASGWALTPQTYHEIWRPSQLEAARRTFRCFLHSDRWGEEAAPGRVDLLQASVSNGPRIEEFSMTAPGPWKALDEREIRTSLKVSSDTPLTEVKLYFGGRLMRCLRPSRKSFSATVRCVSNESRWLYLQAVDAAGRKAFSRALPAHRVRFHHFIGGDRMNGYWWTAVPAPPDQATCKPAGRWAKLPGALYPRLGWGESIGCVSPSQGDHPIGLETDNPDGGVKQICVSPRLRGRQDVEFSNAAPHRTFPLDSTDCVIVEDEVKCELEHYKENGQPRKRVREAELLSAHVRTIGFRWRTAIMLLIETETTFKRDVELAQRGPALALSLLRVFCGARPASYGSSLHLAADGGLVTNDAVLVPAPVPLPAGGYTALYPHPFGVPAVFAFEEADFTIHEAFGAPQLWVGDDLAERLPKAGDTLKRRFLFVLTAGGQGDRDLFAQIHDLYGFDGRPAYEVAVQHGALLDAVYAPRLRAESGAARCTISKAELPNPLGLRVEGLAENWDAGVWDLEEKALTKRLAVSGGVGWLTLDVSRSRDVFIGNLLVADNPDVIINVLELTRSRGRALVHNPTAGRIVTEVRSHSALPARAPKLRRQVELPPGAELTLEWP